MNLPKSFPVKETREALNFLLHYHATRFICGSHIDIEQITPHLVPVKADWHEGLFHLACLTWAIPVDYTRGYRYLILDSGNAGSLIGIFALSETNNPNVMNGDIVGAVPPYNMLLGGKLVTCLMRTKEVHQDILEKLSAPLYAITVASHRRRSSLYNRLKLAGVSYMQETEQPGTYIQYHANGKLLAFDEVARLALDRWVKPRSERDKNWFHWYHEDLEHTIFTGRILLRPPEGDPYYLSAGGCTSKKGSIA